MGRKTQRKKEAVENLVCYVCGKEIKPRKANAEDYDPRYVKTHVASYHGELVLRRDLPVYIGQDKYRHESCNAGSAQWMKAQRKKRKKDRSELYEDYIAVQRTTHLFDKERGKAQDAGKTSRPLRHKRQTHQVRNRSVRRSRSARTQDAKRNARSASCRASYSAAA